MLKRQWRGLAGLKVLIVEDEYLLAADMTQVLREDGVEVVGPAATLEAATRLVNEEGPLHAAILDINLRGAMVYPLAERLMAQGVPIVFATGYSAHMIPSRFAKVLRIEKPVSPAALREAIVLSRRWAAV